MTQLPYQNVRIIEKSSTLTGRLIGLLFADQGAEVFIERTRDAGPGEHDIYLDRGKVAVPPAALNDTSSADVIVVDGDMPVDRRSWQILLRVTAALPGDGAYGHLAADCSEDLLNALVGIFTDMAGLGRALGRPVIYTPLPICSVYAGVHGAIAAGAALADRERSGHGREIVTSRLAGGLSAIGALTLTSRGTPEHLGPARLGGLPAGLTIEQFQEMTRDAARSPERQLWMAQRFSPLSSPFKAADGRLVLTMVAPNRRLTERLLKAMCVWQAALAAGMVSESCYDPAAMQFAGRNLAGSLDFTSTSLLADLLEAAFTRKPAAEWERTLCSAGVPCVAIQSWEEWKQDSAAREAGLFADVQGSDEPQIGRSAWIASAQPYPGLAACRHVDVLPARTTAARASTRDSNPRAPLDGFTVVDLCNVVAGPACGRVFVELGATVIKIDPMRPEHVPPIMVTFAAETAVGKRSLILDTDTPEGRTILHQIVATADLIVANKLDSQFARMGLDPASLKKLNPRAIGVQLSAHRGEMRGPRHDYPGYDPALQGLTGIMMRFGAEGCPTFHGIASCVDYLCGYLGAWAGVSALAARERRNDGAGDWAETSLAAAATLIQLLLQRTPEPTSARGPHATGRTAGERTYQVADGWLFAQSPRDLSGELAPMTVADALTHLASRGIDAVPIQTLRDLVDRHRITPSTTIAFEKRERDGWESESFAPTWYAFDGVPAPRPAAPPRIGSDAAAILATLGYTASDVERLKASGVIGPVEWLQQSTVGSHQSTVDKSTVISQQSTIKSRQSSVT
jgi:crotonobetainyl-CoA:carnitine CoA-transferase CaiB-like acyl-CoA transferase